ncbi:MAG: hypothetical protein VXV97_06955, partial [Pseudomonadota bacterium]|nr:hypothetical protein [Pseudomonadota bacterium]
MAADFYTAFTSYNALCEQILRRPAAQALRDDRLAADAPHSGGSSCRQRAGFVAEADCSYAGGA